jgi:hypothetical protein
MKNLSQGSWCHSRGVFCCILCCIWKKQCFSFDWKIVVVWPDTNSSVVVSRMLENLLYFSKNILITKAWKITSDPTCQSEEFCASSVPLGARGSAVGWGTMLQAGRLQVRFPMRSLNFFNLLYPPSRTMTLGLTQPLTEMSTRGVKSGRHVRPTPSLPSVSLTVSQPYGPPMACYRDSFTFLPQYLWQLSHLYTRVNNFIAK